MGVEYFEIFPFCTDFEWPEECCTDFLELFPRNRHCSIDGVNEYKVSGADDVPTDIISYPGKNKHGGCYEIDMNLELTRFNDIVNESMENSGDATNDDDTKSQYRSAYETM